MPYYKAIIHIPGGKELKVEKNTVPDELYHAMRSVKEPDIVHVFSGNLELTDELHVKLQKSKTYSTYVIYGGHYNEGEQEGEAFRNDMLFGVQQGNLVTLKESVFGYQILLVEYMYVDEPIPYENRAEPTNEAGTENV